MSEELINKTMVETITFLQTHFLNQFAQFMARGNKNSAKN
jgi:hypothetical protein